MMGLMALEARVDRSLALREISWGGIELERDDAKRGADGLADLIDGRAAALEIRHHLGRHRGWIGGHAARHHAVISGKHENRYLIKGRQLPPLPAPKPGHKLLEPSKASLRFGQARLTPDNSRRGVIVALWQM